MKALMLPIHLRLKLSQGTSRRTQSVTHEIAEGDDRVK
jgi:hypothetical protein